MPPQPLRTLLQILNRLIEALNLFLQNLTDMTRFSYASVRTRIVDGIFAALHAQGMAPEALGITKPFGVGFAEDTFGSIFSRG